MALFDGPPDSLSSVIALPSQRLARIAFECESLSGSLHRLHTAFQRRKELSAPELAEARAFFAASVAGPINELKSLLDTEDSVLLNVRSAEWK